VLRNDPTLKRILKNSAWLLSAKGASLPLQVAQSVLVARLLGVEGFGAIGVVMVYIATARRITSFRMDEVVVKFVTDALAVRDDRQLAAATVKIALLAELGSTLLAFALVWLSVPYAASWFLGDAAPMTLFYVASINIVIEAVLESTTGVLQVLNQYRAQAIADVAGRGASLLAVVVVFAMDGGPVAILVATLVGELVTSAILLWSALRALAERLGRAWLRVPLATLSAATKREIRAFAISTNLGAALSMIVKDSELLWLGYFTSPADAGLYKLAKSWISMVVLPAGPLVKSFYPEIAAAIVSRDHERTTQLLRKGTKIAALWIVPAGLGFLALSPIFVPRLYGDEYVPAIASFAILLVGIGLARRFFWLRPVVLALGRPEIALRITALHSVLKVVLVTLLVPIGGFLAMSAITAGLFALGVALASYAVFPLLRERSTHPPAHVVTS